MATTIGVLAGLVQILGLLRWVYVVPALARAHADQTLAPEQREAHAAVFRALHQYLGIGVGLAAGSAEFLGPTEERGLGSRRSRDPTPLHRMVKVAARDGHRVDRLTDTHVTRERLGRHISHAATSTGWLHAGHQYRRSAWGGGRARIGDTYRCAVVLTRSSKRLSPSTGGLGAIRPAGSNRCCNVYATHRRRGRHP